MSDFDPRRCDYPVFATQGGGHVRKCENKYIFVDPPSDFPGIQAGDEMHEKWGVIPANSQAEHEMLQHGPGGIAERQ